MVFRAARQQAVHRELLLKGTEALQAHPAEYPVAQQVATLRWPACLGKICCLLDLHPFVWGEFRCNPSYGQTLGVLVNHQRVDLDVVR